MVHRFSHMPANLLFLSLSLIGHLSEVVSSLPSMELEKEEIPTSFNMCDFLSRLRDKHEPFVFKNAVPIGMKMSEEKIKKLWRGEKASVSFSENGYHGPSNGDSQTMIDFTMEEFFRLSQDCPSDDNSVEPSCWRNSNISYYTSQQRLPTALKAEIEKEIPSWVGFRPDRIFLWQSGGNVPPHFSTMHYDDYLNVYFMANGTKTFQLIPPWESDRLYETMHWGEGHPSAQAGGLGPHFSGALTEHWRQRFRENRTDGVKAWWNLEGGDDVDMNDRLGNITRYHVELQAGDILILPSRWWHTTLHSGLEPTIAINTWFIPRHPQSHHFVNSGKAANGLFLIKEKRPMPPQPTTDVIKARRREL